MIKFNYPKNTEKMSKYEQNAYISILLHTCSMNNYDKNIYHTCSMDKYVNVLILLNYNQTCSKKYVTRREF